jgi:bacillithiol synthase
MIERVPLSLLYPEARLAIDYSAGALRATSFFTHAPHDIDAAARARGSRPYPRESICDALTSYNRGLGASEATMRNIQRLRDRSTLCVIGGQQAGFLGGPIFTAYKILTTIRLTRTLAERLGRPMIPCFWLATEDHDFTEINHAAVLKSDGEVGSIRFEWEGRGRPIADLPVTPQVRAAVRAYLDAVAGNAFHDPIARAIAPHDDEDYCGWHARLWSERFADDGLVLVEPSLLRAPGRELLRALFERRKEVGAALDGAAARLRGAGYVPVLDPMRAGLFTFDETGRRVRTADRPIRPADITGQPERFSPDAALRPLLADTVLPIAASVLGPGELAYHALLRPLYELFDMPQPVYVPREGYTIVSDSEARLLAEMGLTPHEMLAPQFNPGEALDRLLPPSLARRFDRAGEGLDGELAALRQDLAAIDPGLESARLAAESHAMGAIERLRARTARALAARHGVSAGDLQRVRNALLPRGRPQERVFPIPHFESRQGPAFLRDLQRAGGTEPGEHGIITPEGFDD